MEKPQSGPLELFYSYSHKDEELRNQLENHLVTLRREGIIKEWYDRRISGGREWKGQIDEHLKSADIILLLVSSDFLASDYCYDVEVKLALERHEAGEARVIPIILRSCDWMTTPLGELQALPKDALPVKKWEDPDDAFLDIAKGIRKVAEEIRAKREAETQRQDEQVKPAPQLHIPNRLIVDFVRRRDREDNDIVERLKRELAPDDKRLIVLWGAGGVGKTEIAAEAARGLVHTFGERIIWVSADGRESFTLSYFLDETAHQLGHDDIRQLAIEPKKEAVRDAVTAAPTLIVLDNFETIAPDEAERCADWLAQPALCSALITTRQKIEGLRNFPIETMRPEEAHDLLERLIAQAHEPHPFINLDRARVIRIAEANPLVLQWIFGQIDLAQDPDEVLDDLAHGEGTAAERVFDRSYNLPQLNNGGRAVLLALALFVPSATRPMLAAVAASGLDRDRRRFRDATRILAALWLVHTTDDGKRLAVGGLTRELAIAHLSIDPRGKTIRPRFVSHFLRYAKSHQRQTAADLNALEDEKDNILNAMDTAYGMKDWRSVMSLCYALHAFLDLRGYWDEAIQRGEQALQAARNDHADKDISNFARDVAIIYQQQGDLVTARQLLDESLEIKKVLGDQSGIATTIHYLSILAQNEGDIEEALRLCNESFEISKKLRSQNGIAASLHELGLLAEVKGEADDALRFYDESLEISKKLGNQRLIAATMHQLGKLAQEKGDVEEAFRLCEESLEISKKLGNQRSIAISLYSLGRLAQEKGEVEEAFRLHNKSLGISKKLGDQTGIAASLHDLGVLKLADRQFDDAETLLEQSISIFKHLGNNIELAECLESMSRLRLEQECYSEARTLLNESLRLAEKVSVKLRIASVKHSLGLLAGKETNKAEAERLFREALSIFEKSGSHKAEVVRRDLERLLSEQ